MDITVALGGGGARGVAHRGVVQALQEQGFTIRALAGTSIGGLIGALLATGYSPTELRQRMCQLDQRKLFGQRPGDLPSLLGLAGLTDVLHELVGELRFEDLKIPFAVTAVDIVADAPVVIRSGRLVDAVLATIAIPGIFPPRPTQAEGLLVDGGMINPVPVDVARALGPGLPILAVPLTSILPGGVGAPAAAATLPIPGLQTIQRLRVGQALNTFLLSWETSTRLLTELRLERDQPDAILRPRVEDIQVLGVIDVDDVFGRGVFAVADAPEELARLKSWRVRASRWAAGLARPKEIQ